MAKKKSKEKITPEDIADEYLKKTFSASEEEIREAMEEMKDVDDLTSQIVGLCLSWAEEKENMGGQWGNGLVMALTKATSYLLIALEKQRDPNNKHSIIDMYQAALPVCLDITRIEMERNAAEWRRKQAEEGTN